MKRHNKYKLPNQDHRSKAQLSQLWNNQLQLDHPDREDEYDNAYNRKSSELDSIDLEKQSGSPLFHSNPQLDHPDEPDEYDKAYRGESPEPDFLVQKCKKKNQAHRDLELPSPNSRDKTSPLDKEGPSVLSDILNQAGFQNCIIKPQKEVNHLRRQDSSLPPPKTKECAGIPPAKSHNNTIDFSSPPDLVSKKAKFERARAIFLNEPFEISDQDTFSGPIEVSDPTIPIDNFSGEDSQEKEKEKNLALQLAEDFCQRMQIICVKRTLYLYNGSFYSPIQENDLRRLFFRMYRHELSQVSTLSVTQNAVSLIWLCIDENYDTFPVNENLIVFTNGTLEIDTGTFRKSSPADLVSSALDIKFDPTQWEMPVTEHFLKTIANGDPELYLRMLQVIGYLLSNDTKAKSFVYLQGVGNAGKSRFCDLVASFFPLVGPNKVARVAQQDLGKKYALANLVNAKVNISEDLPDAPLTPTTVSRIKMISDSNRLEAEAKYVQSFSFRPLCKLLFASNHPLRLKEYDAAFVNRVVFLPFLHAIPREKQDRNILEKMKAERSALFNHAFKAYKQLVASGYAWAGGERFKPDITVVNASVSADKQMVLNAFVSERLLFDKDAVTATSDLQTAYNQFCLQHGSAPIAGDRFSRELYAVLPSSVERIKIGNQRRGFKGIRLKAILYGT